MDNQKIDRLQKLLDDEVLLKVIEEVFYKTADENQPTVAPNIPNAELGETYRAYTMAKEIIKTGFINLLSYKRVKKGDKPSNRGK